MYLCKSSSSLELDRWLPAVGCIKILHNSIICIVKSKVGICLYFYFHVLMFCTLCYQRSKLFALVLVSPHDCSHKNPCWFKCDLSQVYDATLAKVGKLVSYLFQLFRFHFNLPVWYYIALKPAVKQLCWKKLCSRGKKKQNEDTIKMLRG